MASRKRKRALAMAREVAQTAATDYDPHAAALATEYAQSYRDARVHDAAEEARRKARQSQPQPLDWLDAANDEYRWEFEQMHASHVMDDLGAPVLKDSFAGYLDNRRAARYHRALLHLRTDRAAQATALRLVLEAKRETPGLAWDAAELSASAILSVTGSLLRLRTWKAARSLEADCQGDLPIILSDYISHRRKQLRRRTKKARLLVSALQSPRRRG